MHTNKALTIYFFLSFFSLLNLTNKAARAADFYNNKTTKQDNLANVQAVSFCKSKKKGNFTNERGGHFCFVVL